MPCGIALVQMSLCNIPISLVLALFYAINLALAQDVTISMNSTRLVTVPPNLLSPSTTNYFENCGGHRQLSETGQLVSLSFVGTRVTANFLRYDYGAQVQIALDGSNATQVDTYAVPGLASDGTACTPIQYISDVLSAKQHTINVTVLGARSGVSRPYVHIHSFIYTPAEEQQPRRRNVSVIVGPVVGGVALLLLIIVALCLLRRRRRRSRNAVDANPHDAYVSGPLPAAQTEPMKTEARLKRPEPSSPPSTEPNPFVTPSASPPPSGKLTDAQLDIVQRLAERNIQPQALGAVINSMMSEPRGAETGQART